jgi:hypothetical protein
MPAVIHRPARVLFVACLAACAEGSGGGATVTPPLAVGIESVLADVVLPGSRVQIRGDGFLESATFEVTLDGSTAGGAVLSLPAERVDDRTMIVTFPPEQVGALPEGTLAGDLVLAVDAGAAHGEAIVPVQFDLRHALDPTVTAPQAGVFPQTPMVLLGQGFLLDGEGQSLLSMRGTFTPDAGGPAAEVSLTEVPLTSPPLAAGQAPERGIVETVFDPAWMGISPGHFQGEIQVTNQGRGWSRESTWIPVRLDLLPPAIEAISPGEASRGQKITVLGQGFLGGEAGTTFVRLEGDFQPDVGESRPLPAGGLELSPVWLSGNELAFSMRVHYDADCQSRDLGANPGVMTGTATPVIARGDETVEGVPAPVTFRILPSKQVVWLRFLPAFTDSLRIFGLRNVSGAVQTRVLEVLRRDYSGINMDFRLVEPSDFLDYAILEVGGPDPNGQQLFGLDNTPDLDHCNERLADNLAGRNADGAGYGGIFVESFLQFSPATGSENPLADPTFDAIFADVRETPVTAAEYPDGPRGGTIAQAIHTLGSLVGNTATHELGHSLGLPVFPGCGEYHTAPGPMQIMDCGADRPFSERAELDGGHGAFNPEDIEYLQSVLPL